MPTDENVGRRRSAPRDEPPPDPKRRRDRRLLVFSLGFLGSVSSAFPQLATGTPGDLVHWSLLIGGALAAGLVTAAVDWVLLAGPRTRSGARFRPLRRRVLAAGSVVVGLLLGIGIAAHDLAFRIERAVNGCPEPVELAVLTSPDSVGPTRALADDYEAATAQRDAGCPQVSVYVFGASDATVRQAMPTGWQADDITGRSPRPDVWLPDSSLLVAQVLAVARTSGRTVPVDGPTPSVASSPVVIAVPTADIGSIKTARTGASWRDLLDATSHLPGGLVRPDPIASMTGQLATTAIYAEAPDFSTIRAIEARLATAADRGSYPLADSADQLCQLRRAAGDGTAMITSEQDLVEFNRGDPLGSACLAVDVTPAGPALTAFYPRDTPALDHPFVEFDWRQPNEPESPQHRMAGDFRMWLTDGGADAALLAVGLRPPGAQLTPPLTDQFGVVQNALSNADAPSVGAAGTAMARYARARRTGRVLLALDTSGSMGRVTGRDTATRLAVAAAGIRQSLTQMGPTDEFGLEVFPAAAGDSGVRQLVPIGPRDGVVGGRSRRAVTEELLTHLSPAGDTPLGPAIVSGVNQVNTSIVDDQVRALVVLTDGVDTSGLDPAAVVSAVRGKGVRVFVVAIAEASCTDDLPAGVTAATGGACYQADVDTIGPQLAQLFALVWEGAGDVA